MGINSEGMLILAVHVSLNSLMVDENIPTGDKLY